ncbi:hypothetical protein AB0C84_10160 [Actinomadura sp. NPDC048955]|uniref:hypothetical protein n=1 Tax=Actinomadura sp. NPDC048955 TaxID=3158228 RepID=UPI0034041AF7
MRSGRVSEHRTSALPTSGGGGSCWPGLPTPRARDSKGRGYSDGLPAVVELLPTPTVSETNGTGPPGNPRNDTLRARVALLPTPRASVNENRQTRRTPSQEAGTHGLNLAAEVCSLLPTPRATDGTKGGPNQRGTSGDLMLPSAVARMSTGAPTGPPSTDGPAPSGGQLLLPGCPPDAAEPTN